MAMRRARYRITDVAASEATPTGRVVGVDDQGREVAMEAPVAWIRGAQRGDLLAIEFQIERPDGGRSKA